MAIPNGIIGVVHLPALPKDPCHQGQSIEEIERMALSDASAIAKGGAAGMIVENYGSAPFPKSRIDAFHISVMTRITHLIRQSIPAQCALGINCLRNDPLSALAIAKTVSAQFIRVNVHTGVYVTDQGVIEGQAHDTLKYRNAIGAEKVSIAADILVKHASPLAPITPQQAAEDCVSRGLADALIVTGDGTGKPVSVDILNQVRLSVDAPLLIGSGLNQTNAKTLLPLSDGAIVGTSIKVDGKIHNPVDPERVRALVSML